jgi:hypothetical protein
MQHPERWRRDLNPNLDAGQNDGQRGNVDHGDWQTANDVGDLNRRLRDHGFTDDELKQVPVIPAGERLEAGATYFDLARPERGEFTTRGDENVGRDQVIVPKSGTPYTIWNNLVEALATSER